MLLQVLVTAQTALVTEMFLLYNEFVINGKGEYIWRIILTRISAPDVIPVSCTVLREPFG